MRIYQPFVKYFLTPFRSELHAVGISDKKNCYVEVAVQYDEYLKVVHDPELPISPFSIPAGDAIILSMGRLHPDKGHEYAIRAWPEIVSAFPDAWLLIVGNGADEERLRALASAGKTDRVVFAGFRSDVTDLFSRSCVFLRTSVNEGVNLSTIAAMAAKMPVIGFKVQAPKEVINNENNGLLVEACNAEALAHAVKRLLGDQSLAETLSENARRTIIELYDPELIVNRYIEVYQSCVRKA
jgi:glycosyltransferase involved in cell wall biosynthesis